MSKNFKRSQVVRTTERLFTEAGARGKLFAKAGSGNGPQCVVDGLRLTNFGSCSYMGLEKHPALLAGVTEALAEYGTQFSFSRAYLECPLYVELEASLDRITGRHTLVTPTTTLGHAAALPVLVDDEDLVLIDQFAHASCHMATDLLKNTHVERVRHNRMDLLEAKLKDAPAGKRVWYIADGVYSMLGDFAPFDALEDLLSRFPQLHVYLDDAHAVSWAGTHGRGIALERLGHHDRVVVALSLNKAFSAAGGAIALPSAELRRRIRLAGGPMIFSGPVQPPMLGAAAASARLHLDPVFASLQAELHERITVAERAIERHGLTVANRDKTPIFMVQFDSQATLHDVLDGVRDRGYYCCLSVFPAVPMDKPSLRFTVSRHNTLESVEQFVGELAEVVRERFTYRLSACAE